MSAGPDAGVGPGDLPLKHLSEHLELGEQIGQGGMGVVYRALDRRLGREVALKTLPVADAGRYLSLKQEFRTRAGLAQDNLVRLYELHADGDRPWLTMELVEGVDLLSWVRGATHGATSTLSVGSEDSGAIQLTPATGGAIAPEAGQGLDAAGQDRLRAALVQLLLGLDALHRAGLVHRDVKPANTRVTPEGRLVLLDFGLALVAAGPGADAAGREGTPRYMAPEQLDGGPVGPAADLYAVGELLYEGLTGRSPVPEGSLRDQRRWKRQGRPVAPEALVEECDAALAALAMDCLEPDPAARPSAADALARLGEASRPLLASPLEPLVGRRAERVALMEALARARGGPVVVHVHGPSGIGKSHLVTAFLAEAEAGGAFALAGRCHPDEVVPYNALDAAIDHLARRLRARRAAPVQAPPDADALVRLFPALRAVPGIDVAPSGQDEDLARVRRRGFEALRALLARVAEGRPLVLWLDDVHWGDQDSAELVEVLIAPGTATHLLLTLSYRTEERDRSPFLQRMVELGATEAALGLAGSAPSVDLPLAPLDEAEVRGVLAEHLPPERVVDALVTATLRETGGNPFMVALLGRHLAAAGAPTPGTALGVDHLLADRLGALDDEATRLLQVAAVAVGPLAGDLVIEAAALPGAARLALGRLADERLLRLLSDDGALAVAPYHDRVRQAALDRLGGGRTGVSRKLAEVFEVRRADDVESLLLYWEGAGERPRAGIYAEKAGERAAAGLAFERAAALYTRALDLQGAAADRPKLLERVARAQAGQGLGPASAASFDAAADALVAATGDADDLRALELRSEAADQHLAAGYYVRGWRASRAVLEALGVSIPGSELSAALSSLWRRLRYLIFGFRAPDPRPPQTSRRRLQMEALLNTSLAFAGLHAGLADAFRLRAIDLAVQLGDARALLNLYVYEATMLVHLDGALILRRRQEASALAERYARELDPDYASARLEMLGMCASYLEGNLDGAVAHGLASVGHLREGSTRRHYTLALNMQYVLDALGLAGRIRELREQVAQLRPDFEARGDVRGLQVCYEGQASILWIVDGRPDLARRGEMVVPREDEKGEGWPEALFGNLSPRRPFALCAADLAEEKPWEAWRTVLLLLRDIDRGIARKIRGYRVFTGDVRARVAVAAAAAEASRPSDLSEWTSARLRQQAQADRIAIAAGEFACCAPQAAVLGAALALARGEPTAPLLREAVDGFGRAGLALHRACAQLCLADALPPSEGEPFRVEAMAWMAREGVVAPEAVRRVHTPTL